MSAQTVTHERERKIISISPKRQITIPQKFFMMLGVEDEAECIVRDNELVIRPLQTLQDDGFAEQILADLIGQGLSGEQLLKAFKETQAKMRPAVERMLKEADAAARGEGEYSTHEEIFGKKRKK